METKKITDLHREHVEWLNKFAFYDDDLKVMNHRLQEAVKKVKEKEALAMAEHFQNQFELQKSQINSMTFEIKQHEKTLVADINDYAEEVHSHNFPDHSGFRKKVERFEDLFNAMRREFLGWLSKVL